MQLRRLLDRLSDVDGMMGEEKDPEEFLRSLLEQTLKMEPLIKLTSGQKVIVMEREWVGEWKTKGIDRRMDRSAYIRVHATEKEQGRIHGFPSRVRVGRGHIWGHQSFWAGAVRSKKQKKVVWPTDQPTDKAGCSHVARD